MHGGGNVTPAGASPSGRREALRNRPSDVAPCRPACDARAGAWSCSSRCFRRARRPTPRPARATRSAAPASAAAAAPAARSASTTRSAATPRSAAAASARRARSAPRTPTAPPASSAPADRCQCTADTACAANQQCNNGTLRRPQKRCTADADCLCDRGPLRGDPGPVPAGVRDADRLRADARPATSPSPSTPACRAPAPAAAPPTSSAAARASSAARAVRDGRVREGRPTVPSGQYCTSATFGRCLLVHGVHQHRAVPGELRVQAASRPRSARRASTAPRASARSCSAASRTPTASPSTRQPGRSPGRLLRGRATASRPPRAHHRRRCAPRPGLHRRAVRALGAAAATTDCPSGQCCVDGACATEPRAGRRGPVAACGRPRALLEVGDTLQLHAARLSARRRVVPADERRASRWCDSGGQPSTGGDGDRAGPGDRGGARARWWCEATVPGAVGVTPAQARVTIVPHVASRPPGASWSTPRRARRCRAWRCAAARSAACASPVDVTTDAAGHRGVRLRRRGRRRASPPSRRALPRRRAAALRARHGAGHHRRRRLPAAAREPGGGAAGLQRDHLTSPTSAPAAATGRASPR